MQIIKNPMDFGTIKYRLEMTNYYKDPREVGMFCTAAEAVSRIQNTLRCTCG